MVNVFREVARLLKPDGTLWVNIGDSYVAKPKSNYGGIGAGLNDKSYGTGDSLLGYKCQSDRYKSLLSEYKNKDLIGIPWMLAFALRKDGWYLRQDIIWHKPNPMPESVKDRCTKSHEYLFLLSKKQNYYFDNEAIQEECVCDSNSSYDTELNSKFSKYKDNEQEASVRGGMNHDRGNNIVEIRKELPTQEEFVFFMRRVSNAKKLSEESEQAERIATAKTAGTPRTLEILFIGRPPYPYPPASWSFPCSAGRTGCSSRRPWTRLRQNGRYPRFPCGKGLSC